MNPWRIIQTFVALSITILIALWMMDGFQIFTKDKFEKITIVKDDIFGTEIEQREWVDDFQLGLLPDDPVHPYRSVAFPALLGIALILFAQNRIHSKENS